MILSRVLMKASNAGYVPKKYAKPCASFLSHVEHSGGAVVGIEFLAPHYFSAFALMGFAITFLILRLCVGGEE